MWVLNVHTANVNLYMLYHKLSAKINHVVVGILDYLAVSKYFYVFIDEKES